MKQLIIFIFASLVITGIYSFQSTTPPKKERTYTIIVPAHLANALWKVLHGEQDNVSVGEYKEFMPSVENQILTQARDYRTQDIADSIHQSKDSANAHKK